MGDIKVSSIVTTEFDGMYKVQMTLSPQHAVAVKSLKVVVPIKPEFATYFHACGEGIRYGFSYGYLPDGKTGRLWDSKQVDGQPMLVGSFIPYVWIGNDRGGLCWFADSDQGWMPNDAVPAIEIRRDTPDSVNLVLNLISSNATIDQPRTITFAFQATPVKPIRPGWRMDTWSTGDSFKDWCLVKPRGGDLIWNALPFTLDPAACKKMVDDRHRENSSYNFGIGKYHANAVPYFENNGIGGTKISPEVAYFGDQWRATRQRFTLLLTKRSAITSSGIWDSGASKPASTAGMSTTFGPSLATTSTPAAATGFRMDESSRPTRCSPRANFSSAFAPSSPRMEDAANSFCT